MLQQFREYIQREQLFREEEKVLLALSGGLDSMAMVALFRAAGFRFGVAHCNFRLRAEAADQDAAFVAQTCAVLNVPCYTTAFDTQEWAKSQGLSIQQAARALRYDYLEQIRRENGYDWIATAHHLNDSLETVLYNFAKGCGIRGLHGILPKQGKIIRPLLFTNRPALEEWVQQQGLAYREDASNQSDKYQRNFIRHHIVPQLEKINPAFLKTGAANLQRIREVEFLYLHAIEQVRKKAVLEREGLVFIAHEQLLPEAAATILYELLLPYGFNGNQVRQILYDQHAQSGATFYSPSHRLVIDREHYIVSVRSEEKAQHFTIEANLPLLHTGTTQLEFSVCEQAPKQLDEGTEVAWIDLEQLTFPLKLRRWRNGDVFQPLGMQGRHQSLQDFFTHRKLSRPEKEQVWILESAGEICWVVGMRLDERFKVTKNTQQFLRFR